MEITIRAATETDYAAVNLVFADELAHHVALLPERFQMADPIMSRRWFRDVLNEANKTLQLAVVDGRVVGLVLLIESVSSDDPIHRPRRFLYVDEISVAAEFRGQGIGRRLMQAAEQIAASRAIPTVELNVWEANARAISFYERLGYRTVQRRMVRDLP
ncbi:MAG: GNAT family N-acetyltransferase [Chloroflexota bacterium]|jgi:ribosomal protein S18 acetylase RimI-like enzyme